MTTKTRETEINDAIENLRKASDAVAASDIAGRRAFAAVTAAKADLAAARRAYLAASEVASLAALRVLELAFPECLPVVVLDLKGGKCCPGQMTIKPATPNKPAN